MTNPQDDQVSQAEKPDQEVDISKETLAQDLDVRDEQDSDVRGGEVKDSHDRYA